MFPRVGDRLGIPSAVAWGFISTMLVGSKWTVVKSNQKVGVIVLVFASICTNGNINYLINQF